MTVLIAWLKIKIFTPINEFKASTKVSVLIPVRNEAGNIEALLNDLMKQSYPKFGKLSTGCDPSSHVVMHNAPMGHIMDALKEPYPM